MGFNDLPVEILRQIIRDAITVRGLYRGLRLRLINRRFAAETIDTIYTYRMLDEHLSDGFVIEPSALPPFVESYLEYRLHNVDDDSEQYPVLSAFRRMLHDMVSKNEDLEYEDCVRIMCKVIAYGGTKRVYVLFLHIRPKSSILEEIRYFTAIMTNTTSIIEQRAGPSCPTDRLFPMLDFPRLLARYADFQTILRLCSWSDSRQDTLDKNSLFIAATGEGRLLAVRMLHDYLVDTDLWDLKDRNRRYKTKEVFKTALHTPSKDVWDFIMEKREHRGLSEGLRESYKTELLGECILQGGDLAMIAHLLELGAEVDGQVLISKGHKLTRPLHLACIYGDEDVVKLLLARGANTQAAVAAAASKGHATIVRLLLDHGADPGDALLEAARGGYMVIVGMLLDVGASPAGVACDENEHRSGRLGGKCMTEVPIACAIAMEHAEMTMALAQKGALLDRHSRKACVRVAREGGLESMMALLNGLGVGETDDFFEI